MKIRIVSLREIAVRQMGRVTDTDRQTNKRRVLHRLFGEGNLHAMIQDWPTK